MKRKWVSAVLAVILVMSLLGGCSKQEAPKEETKVTSAPNSEGETGQEEGGNGQIDFNEEPYTINFPVITFGDIPADLQLVEDGINEIVLPKINAKIKLDVISAMEMTNVYTLRASSGEKLDLLLLLPTSTTLMPLVSTNMILPMNELVDQWGQNIQSDLGDILEVGKVNGNLYVIPGLDGSGASIPGIEFNAELVKKYDLEDEIRNLKSINDLEPILALVKEKEPNVIPFSSTNSGTGYTQLLGGFDTLGDSFGALEYGSSDEFGIINQYESERFLEYCKLMRDWYQKGYISKDTLTSQDTGISLAQAGKVFCVIDTYNPINDYGFDLANPTDGMVEWPLSGYTAYNSTNNISVYGLAISVTCERPDKVMQFLNLLYSDPAAVSLLYRGIEGKHYSITADGLIQQDNKSGYYLLLDTISDYRLIPTKAELGIDFKDRKAEFEAKGKDSPALGFTFDSSSYANEIAACNAVKAEYYNVIDCGAVDPEVEIPKFVEKLKAAGLDTIMKAKQQQLNDWVNSQGQ